MGRPTSESPALSLHFPLVVKGQPAVGRELMAQKDFTETLSETVPGTHFFFSFRLIFVSSKISVFKSLLWEKK